MKYRKPKALSWNTFLQPRHLSRKKNRKPKALGLITAFQPGILDKFLTIGPGKLNIQGMYEGFLLATNNFSITTKDDINNLFTSAIERGYEEATSNVNGILQSKLINLIKGEGQEFCLNNPIKCAAAAIVVVVPVVIGLQVIGSKVMKSIKNKSVSLSETPSQEPSELVNLPDTVFYKNIQQIRNEVESFIKDNKNTQETQIAIKIIMLYEMIQRIEKFNCDELFK
jgi:hypothetical protein